MSSSIPHQDSPDPQEAEMLDSSDAAEEIPSDPDAAMDSDGDGEDETMAEIHLQNDSTAHFDKHTDSIFCIAAHPLHSTIVATGGGDDVGYIFSSTTPPKPDTEKPLLPDSWRADGGAPAAVAPVERPSLEPLYKIQGHTDSISALTFTLPSGTYLLSGGLDGKLTSHVETSPSTSTPPSSWTPLVTAQEVEEINWISPSPHPSHPNTIALGATDGSVWIYTINGTDPATALTIVNTFYLHTASCTAGAWTHDGALLVTVAEDSSLYVYDVFGDAAAAGLASAGGQAALVALTPTDARFTVEGGLFSVAVAPNNAFVAVGGAGGFVQVVGLPRLPSSSSSSSSTPSASSAAGAASRRGNPSKKGGTPNTGAAGQILATLQAQTDSIETLSFSPAPQTLLAAGSVDGSIALFDTAHRFAVRRHIREAHEGEAVIKVEFMSGSGTTHILATAGNDGVLRLWDTRGGTAASAHGFLSEHRGHRGDGEGGGILDFVVGAQGRVVTAGDDGVALVFETGSSGA